MQSSIHLADCKQKQGFISLVVYFVSFFLIWSLYVFFAQKYLGENYPFLFSILKLGVIKLLIWTIPVILYLKYHDNVRPLSYLKLQNNIQGGLFYVLSVTFFYFLINLSQQYIILKRIEFHSILSIDIWINVIILAGFTEEILFRGFLLQKLSNLISFWKANIISAFLFLLIHFPAWIYHENFSFINIDMIGIYILGLILGYVFKKSNSLVACILIHSINNFLSVSFHL